ncbi:MAG: FprA family A-type flavoprotein [Candidatus Methylophosphatis roskildensis]|jgi:flavorubredoxin|uniref:FprA family A-type flavoprotein n=1 Tax=Candidatus Methylophosphatis roskildensis TaxID=2899263 RepID=A0A9D7E504_9PROT|nr:FprA family A-type flavoprotein [Candidatus Methylophosphatis roskildensis]MBK7236993.1 FprA family A-type flavoprotein [Sterolibacteriaceae bacterium]MBK7665688.1 FprA family A-type flavoprotein [Sterolibacteriaceae bacterium]
MVAKPIAVTAKPLSERVHWIGALDPAMRTFDVILRTPNGTTYNAYAVRGSAGVAVIDTVKEDRAEQFFASLESIARYDEIRAIVLNHLEPDHSGALPELMRRAPQARLYISESAQLMLKSLLKSDVAYTPVTTGDRVSLGDRTLRFVHTPYLHWPDTQCTYLEEEATLFSGDVFGCHFCDERLFNDTVGDFRFSFEYYYQHIMRPFKQHVIEALELIEPLELRTVAPAHGPILRDRPRSYVARYRELSTPRLHLDVQSAEKTMVIFYISSYGNTQHMAEAIRDGAQEIGGFRVSLYDLEGAETEPFVDLVEEADAILVGSPTINGDAVKPVWDLLSSFVKIHVKGKVGAAFGSYGWSGEAVRMMDDRLRGLKMRVPVGGLRIKLIPTGEELERCREFGREVGGFLVGRQTTRVIDMSELLAS